ncbi:hypothetical protein THF1C08_310035 [Vibrio jasicida]|uniref:Uncharacterized protein n=1 Tax=Vibrio jasicida TaxID=766224 RepID=A0AAU9QNZ3_9VIBR|nr:hypothetical protein THF1C08_310035 [Vibrio jasicida]CAH1597092.1 hypothetical protein THF1A12_310034 [Vibrio jasicida]
MRVFYGILIEAQPKYKTSDYEAFQPTLAPSRTKQNNRPPQGLQPKISSIKT